MAKNNLYSTLLEEIGVSFRLLPVFSYFFFSSLYPTKGLINFFKERFDKFLWLFNDLLLLM